jgi:hypothetical protein
VVIVVRRLIREGWMRYRWESRPASRPGPIRAGSKPLILKLFVIAAIFFLFYT